MLRLLAIALLALVAWKGYDRYQGRPGASSAASVPEGAAQRATPYRCDGRTLCSQMTSCAEATYFLRNCPGTKMDGNHDGIPCEKQWCRS
jgi:Excalibur calcium-binding domain